MTVLLVFFYFTFIAGVFNLWYFLNCDNKCEKKIKDWMLICAFPSSNLTLEPIKIAISIIHIGMKVEIYFTNICILYKWQYIFWKIFTWMKEWLPSHGLAGHSFEFCILNTNSCTLHERQSSRFSFLSGSRKMQDYDDYWNHSGSDFRLYSKEQIGETSLISTLTHSA